MSCFSSLRSKMEYNCNAYKKEPVPNSNPKSWDHIILTASNENQALIYQNQIDYRLEKGFLSDEIQFTIVPDIEGKRIGSGGATFNVLRSISEMSNEEDCFSGKRILIIHSGGDSKRIPQYSLCGKLFLPIPRELSKGINSTLFDEIIKSVSELPSRIPAGMLTLAGDILLILDPLQIELNGCDAGAISVSENVRTGRNHGVFIPDEEGNVKKFLHKFTVDELHRIGAEDSNGNVHLDTGAIWFSSKVVKALFSLISTNGRIDYEKFASFANEKARLSFYADFVYPMALSSSLDRFYAERPEGGYTDELKRCRTVLWNTLHGNKMKLINLSPAYFVHFGTTTELLKTMVSEIKKFEFLGWKRIINTNADSLDRFTAVNSFVDKSTSIGNGSYIENSRIFDSKIGKRCIVSNITLDSATIPENTVVHSLKQKDGDYVVRIYGIDDNPKLGFDDGGTFLGESMCRFMQKQSISVNDLWDSEPHDLWNAKLFLKAGSLQDSLKHAIGLCKSSEVSLGGNLCVSLRLSFENADSDCSLPLTCELPLDKKSERLSNYL